MAHHLIGSLLKERQQLVGPVGFNVESVDENEGFPRLFDRGHNQLLL